MVRIGGIFTIIGMIESSIHSVVMKVKKSKNIAKFAKALQAAIVKEAFEATDYQNIFKSWWL